MTSRKRHFTKERARAVAPLLRRYKKTEKKKRCLVCGESEMLTLQHHHIDPDRRGEDPENDCWLCGSCHTVTFKKATSQEAIEALEARHMKKRSEGGKVAWRYKRGPIWGYRKDDTPIHRRMKAKK